MKKKTIKQALYKRENPHFTGDTFYNRYVSSEILFQVKNNNPVKLTGFTFAELELIEKHARAMLWEKEEKQINCNICLLAENMRDCKSCPFYTPKNNTVSK